MPGQRYARGRRAVGECARSGRKMLLEDMVSDGYYPSLMVDPAWREERHPQERLPEINDPVALYRPSPEREGGPTSPVLEGVEDSGNIVLTWTESITKVSQIADYQVFRAVDTGDAALYATVTVDRAYDGEVTNDPLTYTDESVDTGMFSYSYYVVANPVRVGESSSPQQAPAVSNTITLP